MLSWLQKGLKNTEKQLSINPSLSPPPAWPLGQPSHRFCSVPTQVRDVTPAAWPAQLARAWLMPVGVSAGLLEQRS